MKNIAVLASGSGSNLQSLIDACEKGDINGKISIVIASKDNIFAIERAKNHSLPYEIFDKKSFNSRDQMFDKMIGRLNALGIDLIVLAGYLTILNTKIINVFRNKIINVHPSLIPAFCGEGYYGIKVHKAVIEYGCKISGATVHFVDEGADTGAVIAQKPVPVKDSDTAEILQKRVLKVEHKLLPYAVKLFCEDRLKINGRIVNIIKK